nr:filamentous hemagglutinin N-terminal domain-containing protein [Ruegeria lacuscaerulensis]
MTWGQTKTASLLLQAADFRARATVIRGAILTATATLWGTTALAQTLPNGGTVAAGTVMIAQPSGNQLDITQGSGAAVVNWNGFSIGSGSTVNFFQPGQESVILNRVTGDTTSAILGQLNANGQVFLVNPNGIFIGPNGAVNAGGFVASTLDVTDEDFLNGRYRFAGNGSSAAVENAGTISIVPGGYAALIGGQVSNSGLIRVPLGKVGLGAGEQVTLDISGDGFLQVAVPSDSDDAMMEALITNSGRIEANGGSVHLKAASARNAARQVINMSGVIEAQSVGGVSGAVVLGGSGGGVRVGGTIDTSAQETLVETSLRPKVRTQNGGSITITGEAITLAGATLTSDGTGGGDGGTILVGGDFQGGGTLPTAQTTFVDASTSISADGGDEGNGGRVIIWSDDLTEFHGQISARGGDTAGDGGFVEVSGQIDLVYRGFTDLRAPNGETGDLLIDPVNITIPGTFTEAGLEAQLESADVFLTTSVTGTDDGNITINADIDWMAANTLFLIADNMITINGAINAVNGGLLLNAMGAVDGVGRITTGPGGSISVATFNLIAGFWDQVSATLPSFFAGDFIVSPNATFLRATGGNGSGANPFQLTDIYGLQGLNGSSQSFALVNDIDASPTSNWSFGFVPADFSGTLEGNRFSINNLFIDNDFTFGGLFGTLDGTVRNLSIRNADITAQGGGILAGENLGTISGVSVSGSFTGSDDVTGGLVGINDGGTISDSFSTASVTVDPIEADFVLVGGLVGENSGVIQRSFSSGSVTGLGFGEFIMGGLVGENFGSIVDSYSNSDVRGVSQFSSPMDTVAVGGLVGINNGGSVTRSYSNGSVDFSGSDTPMLGGLIGSNSGTVTESFWDTQSSGQNTSAGGTGLSTFQLNDTVTFFNLASAQGWDFENTWAPGSGETGPANYTTSPVVFAIPDDIAVVEGEQPPNATTGTIFGGPSVYLFGPPSDSLDTSTVFEGLNFIENDDGTTTFTLSTSFLLSSAEIGYQVVSLPGSVVTVVEPIPVPPTPEVVVEPIPVPPTPEVEVTPTVDTTITGGGGGGGTAVTTVAEAEATLGTVENVSEEFGGEIASCASSGENVSEYLACLAEAMDDYASELDGIVKGLPPGLESVGDIIRGASAGIREAGDEANRRLSLATTAEERNAIRREAVQQARRQIRQAQREIRKAITLIRATDPELAIVQNQQVETIVAAVGQADIGLTRAIGL